MATGVAGAGEEMGGGAPPPPEMGVKMFELAQTNLFTPERKKGGGGHPLAIHPRLMAGAGFGGDGVCWEGLDLDADLVGADGHGGFQPGGGDPGGVRRVGAWHRLPPQVPAPARRNPHWGPPTAAPPQPPGGLPQGLRGHLLMFLTLAFANKNQSLQFGNQKTSRFR